MRPPRIAGSASGRQGSGLSRYLSLPGGSRCCGSRWPGPARVVRWTRIIEDSNTVNLQISKS